MDQEIKSLLRLYFLDSNSNEIAHQIARNLARTQDIDYSSLPKESDYKSKMLFFKEKNKVWKTEKEKVSEAIIIDNNTKKVKTLNKIYDYIKKSSDHFFPLKCDPVTASIAIYPPGADPNKNKLSEQYSLLFKISLFFDGFDLDRGRAGKLKFRLMMGSPHKNARAKSYLKERGDLVLPHRDYKDFVDLKNLFDILIEELSIHL